MQESHHQGVSRAGPVLDRIGGPMEFDGAVEAVYLDSCMLVLHHQHGVFIKYVRLGQVDHLSAIVEVVRGFIFR